MKTKESINAVGLEKFLNQTAHRHNGLDYRIFRLFLDKNISAVSGARAFGVTRATWYKYIRHHYDEQEALANKVAMLQNKPQEASNDKKGTN